MGRHAEALNHTQPQRKQLLHLIFYVSIILNVAEVALLRHGTLPPEPEAKNALPAADWMIMEQTAIAAMDV